MGQITYNVIGMLDGAAETQVYSELDGPIESLSILRRSLLFAELSNLSYLSRCEAGILVQPHRLPRNSLLRSRRCPGLHLCQRRRRRRHLPRHGAGRLERHARPTSIWHARWPKRRAGFTAASSARSTTFGRGWNRRSSTTRARCGSPATRSARRWPPFAPAAANFRTSNRTRARCSPMAARASAVAAT